MQLAINRVADWAESHSFLFSFEKSQTTVFRYTRQALLVPSLLQQYSALSAGCWGYSLNVYIYIYFPPLIGGGVRGPAIVIFSFYANVINGTAVSLVLPAFDDTVSVGWCNIVTSALGDCFPFPYGE